MDSAALQVPCDGWFMRDGKLVPCTNESVYGLGSAFRNYCAGCSPTRQPGLDAEWGYRLASLADGEGCFVISRTNKAGFNCFFAVKMRADDSPFLDFFADIFGGKVRYVDEVRADGHNRAPQAYWRVERKAECLALVEIFDIYPLLSKKARDYEVWREAVIYWNTLNGRFQDWEPMRIAFEQIRGVRRYVA